MKENGSSSSSLGRMAKGSRWGRDVAMILAGAALSSAMLRLT